MKYVVIAFVILATVNAADFNVTTTKSPKNETALNERPNRDSKRYISSYHERGLGDFYSGNSNKKSNRLKSRRRQRPKTTTPQYDYDDFEGYSMDLNKNFGGYDQYFKHPYVGNVGKIFNQEDINDFYLKNDHDYGKLYKETVKPFKPSVQINSGSSDKYSNTKTSFKNNYGSLLDYDSKKDSSSLPSSVTTTTWGNMKNYESKSPWSSSDWKKPSSTSYNNPIESNKDIYGFDKYNDYKTTPPPFKSYDTRYPEKSYASNFNFDTKPFPEIEPTRYTIPSHTFSKYTVKNTDYVSEFDMKANPVSTYADNSDIFSELNKDMYNLNKHHTPDFTKSFYEFNKEEGGKPYFNVNYNDQDFRYDNLGYASSYTYDDKNPEGKFDFSPYYGNQNYGADYTKNTDSQSLRKDRFSPANSIHTNPMQPIIVPVPQPYPVKVPVAKPVAVPIVKEIKVPIEKVVPYPVVKNVPYPVEKRIPVPVEKQVPVPVPKPYPVKIPVIKNIYHHAPDDNLNHEHNHQHSDEEIKPPARKRPRHRGRAPHRRHRNGKSRNH